MQNPNLPTSRDSRHGFSRADVDANDILVKPIDVDRLLLLIKALCR